MSEQDESPAGDAVPDDVTTPTGSATSAGAAGAGPVAGAAAEESAATIKPSLRARLRPLELLGISLALAVFAGLITILTTRDWLLTVVVLGVAFVLCLVTLAMLALGGYEPPKEPPSAVLDREPPH